MTIAPIEDQIAEVEREIRQRERLYPAWIEKNRLKPETAAKKLSDLHAARASLVWLRDNREWIIPIAAERKRQADRAAIEMDIASSEPLQSVLAAFPGATITDVRPAVSRLRS